MKKCLIVYLLILTIIIAGCNEKGTDQLVEEENTSTQTPEIEEGTTEAEELDWEGEYVFINDEIEGVLTISNQENSNFNYELTAFKKDWSNTLLASAKFEGQGTIEDTNAQISSTDLECNGILKMVDSQISLELTGDACEADLALSGSYKKMMEDKPDLVVRKDNKIYLNGLSLAGTPSETKLLWGNPDPDNSTEDDIHLFEETNHMYSAEDMIITYYKHKIYAMTVEVDENVLNDLPELLSGEHYKEVSTDTEVFHIPESGELLIYRDNHIAGGKQLLLIPTDENFFHTVESGIYVEVENN